MRRQGKHISDRTMQLLTKKDVDPVAVFTLAVSAVAVVVLAGGGNYLSNSQQMSGLIDHTGGNKAPWLAAFVLLFIHQLVNLYTCGGDFFIPKLRLVLGFMHGVLLWGVLCCAMWMDSGFGMEVGFFLSFSVANGWASVRVGQEIAEMRDTKTIQEPLDASAEMVSSGMVLRGTTLL